jgi:IS30 family transposase
MLKAGDVQKIIAEVLGVDPSTISREKRRLEKGEAPYSASIAQRKANAKRASSKYCGMAVESDYQRKQYIIGELKAHRSPDEISGRIKKETLYKAIGTDAIYQWLYSTRGSRYAPLLCTRRIARKQQKRTGKREMIPNRKGLELRPREGIHAEGDTFLSPKDAGTHAGAIVVIPPAQLILATKVRSMSPSIVCPAFNVLIQKVIVDDITLDNGIENKHHEILRVPGYFCRSHAPWQKPHVENNIGLLRRWFVVKGTNLEMISEETLQNNVHVLNGKYRKSLGYKSAYEVAVESGIITESFVKEKYLLAEKYRLLQELH